MHVFSFLCLIIISVIIITDIYVADNDDRDNQQTRFTSVKFSTDVQGVYRQISRKVLELHSASTKL
jgi:capsular polysaccharide biosynthesis protein